MSKDTIYRQAAIDSFPEDALAWDISNGYIAPHYVRKILETLPSAEPETAKRIVFKTRNGIMPWYQCDTCNEPVDAQDNFCRGCGRRLNG